MATDLATAWRPFEPSREAAEDAQRELEQNTCNRHRDCAAADERFRADPRNRDYYGRLIRTGADHCHDDDCEECFGC